VQVAVVVVDGREQQVRTDLVVMVEVAVQCHGEYFNRQA
jgi:hypothetical protein